VCKADSALSTDLFEQSHISCINLIIHTAKWKKDRGGRRGAGSGGTVTDGGVELFWCGVLSRAQTQSFKGAGTGPSHSLGLFSGKIDVQTQSSLYAFSPKGALGYEAAFCHTK